MKHGVILNIDSDLKFYINGYLIETDYCVISHDKEIQNAIKNVLNEKNYNIFYSLEENLPEEFIEMFKINKVNEIELKNAEYIDVVRDRTDVCETCKLLSDSIYIIKKADEIRT